MVDAGSALTMAQVVAIAREVWRSDEAAVIAAAIAKAESGLRPRAHNAVPPDNSYGLWQINMIGNLGPSRRAQFGLTSNEDLFDPRTNARAAYAISRGGTSWTPWSVYKSGSYKLYVPQARAALGQVGGGGGDGAGGALEPDSGVSSITNPLDSVSEAFEPINRFVSWIMDPRLWMRILMFIAGVLLIAIAVVLYGSGAVASTLLGKAGKLFKKVT
jgi:hypothetical protein